MLSLTETALFFKSVEGYQLYAKHAGMSGPRIMNLHGIAVSAVVDPVL